MDVYDISAWISLLGLSIIGLITLNYLWVLGGVILWMFFTVRGMFKDNQVSYFDKDEKRPSKNKRKESEHFIYDFLYNQKRR